jgi:hypothetical protein
LVSISLFIRSFSSPGYWKESTKRMRRI